QQCHKAYQELIRCVALSRIVYGDRHWRLAQAFANLGYCYIILKDLPAQAKQHAESAKNILLQGVDMSKSVVEKREIMETLVTIYYTLGMAHLMQKNSKESYISLQKVEKMIDGLEDVQERKAITTKISEKDIALALGRACLQQNKPSSAVNYFQQVRDSIISSKGDSSSELISIYQEMAKAEHARKKPDSAIEHLLQAHSISQANYKNLSIEAAQTGLQLAKAYALSGYTDTADKFFTESLQACQTVLGPDDSRTLTAVVEFGKWLVQIDNKQCLDIQAVVYGSQHSKTKGTQNVLNTLQR
ncbi:hypothetical protein GDO86_002500, partial [Hymenochirus boettgeri]